MSNERNCWEKTVSGRSYCARQFQRPVMGRGNYPKFFFQQWSKRVVFNCTLFSNSSQKHNVSRTFKQAVSGAAQRLFSSNVEKIISLWCNLLALHQEPKLIYKSTFQPLKLYNYTHNSSEQFSILQICKVRQPIFCAP